MAQRRYDDEPPRHGIFMSKDDSKRLISQETDYLYELVDGLVYDMTGSSPKHSVLAG